jgi:hypothetical protein
MPRAEPGQLRDAYVPNRRVRLASDVASACVIVLLGGLLGSGFTWGERAAAFDLAATDLQVVKLGLGYLAGPLMILAALPLVLGRSRQVALKRYFRARLVLAAVLWIAGLVILIAKLADLSGDYSLRAGAYVTAAALIVGLIATLSMWPGGLRTVKVDRAGMVRET